MRLYSLQELLQEIGLSLTVPRKNSTPTDLWKPTKYSKNVEQLKPIQKVILRRNTEKISKSTIKLSKTHIL